ncbi:MAG: tyrosine-type recombinase/integrase [Microbacterium sp.]
MTSRIPADGEIAASGSRPAGAEAVGLTPALPGKPATGRRHNASSKKMSKTEANIQALTLAALVTTGIHSEQATRREPSASRDAGPAAEQEILEGKTIADNTRRGYTADWAAFTQWCNLRGDSVLPAHPLTVIAHLAWMANMVDEERHPFYAPGTVARRLAAINAVHSAAGLSRPGDDPEVGVANAGIRQLLARPPAQKTPLLLADLQLIVESLDQTSWPAGVIAHRDAAILTMGMVGAFRRSELAALRIMDVYRHPSDGLQITLSKRTRRGERVEHTKTLPFGTRRPSTCAPCSFARWIRILAAAGDDRAAAMRVVRESRLEQHICLEPLTQLATLAPTAPVFRAVTKHGTIGDRPITGQTVNDMLQRRVAAIGADPSEFGAHSLRSGFITQALRDGASPREVMAQSGHFDRSRVEEYAWTDKQTRENAVARMNL